MIPLFDEFFQMCKDKGFDLPINEGKFWMNKNFIVGINHLGEIEKLYKYKVFDDLSINIECYGDNIDNKKIICFVYILK